MAEIEITCGLEVGEAFFEDVRSKGEVVMVIPRPGGKLLLITKPFYPEGVYRLPSGQIEGDESPEDALHREALEETGFEVGIQRRLGTVRFTFRTGARTLDYESHVMLTDTTSGEPSPQDPGEQISAFREVEPCDLQVIAEELAALPGRWSDWGRFRAPAHRLVYQLLCERPPR